MCAILDKPFRTYEEQLQILESRNIIIEDRNFAVNFLKEFSYYTLVNGYKDTFLSLPNTDNFQPGTRFNELVTMHLIDLDINSIIMKYILALENSLKTSVSYIVAEKFGISLYTEASSDPESSDYLSLNHYTNSGRRKIIAKNLMRKLRKDIKSKTDNPHNCRSEALAHYIQSHNHIPPWILMTELTFNEAIDWYKILKEPERSQINEEFLASLPGSATLNYEEKSEFMTSALTLLRKFRNKIAHNHKTFQAKPDVSLPKKSYLVLTQKTLSEKEYNQDFGKSDLYAIVNCCLMLFKTKDLANSMLKDLENALEPYDGHLIAESSIKSIFGLPEDIFDRLERIILSKF